jgi:hypothetical protein
MSDNGKRDRSTSVGSGNPKKRSVSFLYRASMRSAGDNNAIVICFCICIQKNRNINPDT